MALTQIVLIRHGESLGNVAAAAANAAGLEAIEAGARDPDVALSPAGLEQATALRRGLSLLLSDGVSTAIWSSPYRRAVQTAEVALAAGVARPAIRIDERLRDRELGVLDLLTTLGVANRFPLEAARRQWWGKFYHRAPGGESWADVALRLRSFLRDLADSPAERAVLFVHDAVVMLVRYILENLDEHAVLRIRATDPVRNVSITVLIRDGVDWRLDRYNDVSHLVSAGAPVTEHPGEPDVAR